MELGDFFRLLRKYYRVLVAVTLAFTAIGVGVSLLLPATYRASTTLAVRRRVEEANPGYFSYEGYYAQQTAREYADAVVGFLQSDEIVRQALLTVGMPTTQELIGQVSAAIDARKTAPQLVLLQIDWGEVGESADLAAALVSVVKDRSEELNQQGDRAIHIDTLSASPIVEERKPLMVLNAIVGGLVGLFLSVGVVSLVEYLKER